jgi:hypothetical protein
MPPSIAQAGPPRKRKTGLAVSPSAATSGGFPATSRDRVYNEAAGLTLSAWYPPGRPIELEPIGPRERLKAGESASFTEDWWLLLHPFPKKGQQIDLKALSEQVAKQTTATK